MRAVSGGGGAAGAGAGGGGDRGRLEKLTILLIKLLPNLSKQS